MKNIIFLFTLFFLLFSCQGDDIANEIESFELRSNQVDLESEEFFNLIESIPFYQSTTYTSPNANIAPSDVYSSLILWNTLLQVNDYAYLVIYFDGDTENYTFLLIEESSVEGINHFFRIKRPVGGGDLVVEALSELYLVDTDITDNVDYTLNTLTRIQGVQLNQDVLGGTVTDLDGDAPGASDPPADNSPFVFPTVPETATPVIVDQIDDILGGGDIDCDIQECGISLDFLSVYNDCFLYDGLNHNYCEMRANVFSNLPLTDQERDYLNLNDNIMSAIYNYLSNESFSSEAIDAADDFMDFTFSSDLQKNIMVNASELDVLCQIQNMDAIWTCCTDGNQFCLAENNARYQLADELDLTPTEIYCLSSDQAIEVNNFNGDGTNLDLNEIAIGYIKTVCEVPEARFDRFLELNTILENNPWALIEDCIQQEGLDIQDYDYLYNFEMPQSTLDRLNDYPSITHQPIENGNVAKTNIDYYGVELTQLPDLNGNGLPDESPEEAFEAFRLQFGTLASGSYDDFDPSCPGPTTDIWWTFDYYSEQMSIFPVPNYSDEKDRWELVPPYTSPLNTIFLIEGGSNNVLADFLADSGSIIVSEYNPSSHFIGSTLHTSESWSQPFSGNRQWGYVINENGNMEIYTKAIDRAHISEPFQLISIISEGCAMEDYYSMAEKLWNEFQLQIKNWVEDENGQANIGTSKSAHIKNGKIEELLTQTDTINEIECD